MVSMETTCYPSIYFDLSTFKINTTSMLLRWRILLCFTYHTALYDFYLLRDKSQLKN